MHEWVSDGGREVLAQSEEVELAPVASLVTQRDIEYAVSVEGGAMKQMRRASMGKEAMVKSIEKEDTEAVQADADEEPKGVGKRKSVDVSAKSEIAAETAGAEIEEKQPKAVKKRKSVDVEKKSKSKVSSKKGR